MHDVSGQRVGVNFKSRNVHDELFFQTPGSHARSQILRKATVSFVLSVHPSAWNNSTPTGGILMKLDT